MAKSKNKYKKKSEDKFVSYMLIGFSVAFFVIIVSVILFNIVNKPLDYGSFNHIENEQTIYTESEDQYLVYFYTEECSACKTLKFEILSFADSNTNNVKVYLVDLDIVRASGNLTIPTEIQYTPSVVLISNGVFADFASGAGENPSEIPALLDEINAGLNAFIN